MKPMTSFETYMRVIAQKTRDGVDFARIGAMSDAERLRVELAMMTFSGCTILEISKLMRMQSQGCARISDVMHGREDAA